MTNLYPLHPYIQTMCQSSSYSDNTKLTRITLYGWIGEYDFTRGCIYPLETVIPTAATLVHSIPKLEDSLRTVHLRVSIPP